MSVGSSGSSGSSAPMRIEFEARKQFSLAVCLFQTRKPKKTTKSRGFGLWIIRSQNHCVSA
eukprot:649877-Lingulodinium_polyedra.AAC.1